MSGLFAYSTCNPGPTDYLVFNNILYGKMIRFPGTDAPETPRRLIYTKRQWWLRTFCCQHMVQAYSGPAVPHSRLQQNAGQSIRFGGSYDFTIFFSFLYIRVADRQGHRHPAVQDRLTFESRKFTCSRLCQEIRRRNVRGFGDRPARGFEVWKNCCECTLMSTKSEVRSRLTMAHAVLT